MSRVVHRPFDSHAEQWRFAANETGITTGWILRLDADYMMEPALREEIAALVPAPETAAYQIAFTYCMDGKPLRASLYPSLPVLFRRGKGIRPGRPYRETEDRRTGRAARQPAAA